MATHPHPCRTLCGRRVRVPGAICCACRHAIAEGYYLSPAPRPGERRQAGRADRIARYEQRAANGLPLFEEAP